MNGLLLSVQVGLVKRMVMPAARAVDEKHPFWTSGIFKEAVKGPVRVFVDHLEGDEQADLKNHGGPDNVVLAYDHAHYAEWRRMLGRSDLEAGSFGENCTVTGFSDETVCIGDVWRVGNEVELQVTQARQPCFKLGRRLHDASLVKLVRENSWGGWYMRVLRAGVMEAGMGIEMVRRVHGDWSVARAVQTMYARRQNVAAARDLAGLAELSARWKQELLE